MIRYILVILAIFSTTTFYGQQLVSKSGEIRFFSKTPLENIEAVNQQVNIVMDTLKGSIVIKVLLRSFVFEKALMQEHFNENYVESHKYPISVFKGKVINHDSIHYQKEGNYYLEVAGDLTLHGITHHVEHHGTLEISNNKIEVKAQFMLSPEHYKIKIPRGVRKNIASQVQITVNATLIGL